MTSTAVAVIARVGYDANRAYSLALGERVPPWEDAEPADRAMWANVAESFIATDDTSPQAIHDRWLELEAAAGWSFGPTLDNDAKQHPHHVPWDWLPGSQRFKIWLFRTIVLEFRWHEPRIA